MARHTDFDGTMRPPPSGSVVELSWEAPDGTDCVVVLDVSEDREVVAVMNDDADSTPRPALAAWLEQPQQGALLERLFRKGEQSWRDDQSEEG
jgi:hypothetical protein